MFVEVLKHIVGENASLNGFGELLKGKQVIVLIQQGN
jgi:hypothetical protein